MKYNEIPIAAIQPRDHVIFFILDPSAGWNCSRINAINRAMSEAVIQLREIQDTCRDVYTLKIAVLETGMGAYWYSNMPVPVDDFEWQDLHLGFGPMNWKCALLALESQLSRTAMLRTKTMINVPIIIFITNSVPVHDWIYGKDYLQANKWFQHAVKYAITEDETCERALNELFSASGACIKLGRMDQIDSVLPEVIRRATTFTTIGPPAGRTGIINNCIPRLSQEPGEELPIVINPSIFADEIWNDDW